MSRTDIIINEENAREKWGILPTPNTISQLLMPAPLKERVSNASRLEHGTRYDLATPKTDSRILNLELQMTAENETEFYKRHEEFLGELEKDGYLRVSTSDREDVVYRLLYVSFTQYTQFMRGIATFALKLIEPNPKRRTKL